jgi:glycosyltransferase involved in cell wall biosynthesis
MVSRVEPFSATMEREQSAELSLPCFRPVPLPALPERPLVSVLITCYNYGPYVGQAIESALNQTLPPGEIIVSDDGSTDDSCQVVEEYARRYPSVRLVRNIHGGMARCLNAAYRASSGEIVCLLDADDVFLPGKIQSVVNALRNHPEAGFCSHRALLVDHKQRRRGVFPLGAMPEGDCAAQTFRNAGILMGLPPTTNLSLRREVADRIFPVSEEFTGYAEQVIHRLAPFLTELCYVDEPLAEWRQHDKNDQKATHISVKRLDRELGIMSVLWRKQKEYLQSVSDDLAFAFPGLDQSALFRKMQYTRARLTGDPAAPKLYAKLFKNRLGPGYEILFWKYSRYLPRFLFSKAVDLLMTQSIWKELLVRLRARRRS